MSLELTGDDRICAKLCSEFPEPFLAGFERLIDVRATLESTLGGYPDSCNRVEYLMRSVWGGSSIP